MWIQKKLLGRVPGLGLGLVCNCYGHEKNAVFEMNEFGALPHNAQTRKSVPHV